MPDYKDMTYYQLKAECKKQGLNAVGKKPELLGRLGITETAKAPNEPEPDITANLPEKQTTLLPATQEELEQYLPDAKHVKPVNTEKFIAWLTNERLQKLTNRIAPLAAGKGKFEFQINHEEASFQVQFSGKGPIVESTTLIDTDDQIVRRAHQYYTSRLVMGKNNQRTVI